MSTSQRKLKAAEDAGYRRAVRDVNLKLFSAYDVDFDGLIKRIGESQDEAGRQCNLHGFAVACSASGAPEPLLSLIRDCKNLFAAESVWLAFLLGRTSGRVSTPTTVLTDATTEPTGNIRRNCSPAPVHGVVLTDEEKRLVRARSIITAIKSIRARTNLGLKEAKECVDAVQGDASV